MNPCTPQPAHEPYSTLRIHPVIDTPLSRMIRERRQAMRPAVSQTKLAERLGITRSYLSRIEAGQRGIHPQLIPQFVAVMGVDAHDLALAIAGLDPIAFRMALVDPLTPLVPDVTTHRAHLWRGHNPDWLDQSWDDEEQGIAA